MPKKRIDNITAAAMITIAIIFDLFSLIPIVNIITTIAAWFIFITWFYMKGVGFINPKRFATAATSIIVELIPFLSMLPGLTLAIIVTIFMLRNEDRQKQNNVIIKTNALQKSN